MRLNKHMQMSAVGRAGVQRSMHCVLEVRKQRTFEGRPQQRREQVDGADAQRPAMSGVGVGGCASKFSMFADGSL